MLLLYLIHGVREASDPYIYIPLCFYFINMYTYCYPYSSKFTFHYASTLSYLLLKVYNDVDAFTFHYASTLSTTHLCQGSQYYKFTFHYASTLSM